jgi:radical SAM superfamily enzyme YgiQ (UPF0313 family)
MTTAPPENSPWSTPMRLPPLGLSFVAASLEKAGFKVEILDNYIIKKTNDELKQIVKRLNPKIVGITCSSASYSKCIESAKVIKKVLPGCSIVVGGWHPSYVPESMLEHPEIDYVIIGEGERAMVELANCVTNNLGEKSLSKVSGLAFRKNQIIIKNDQKFISDLDEIPFLARHLLPMDLYEREIPFLNVQPVDTMNIVRGCPFKCAFCETRRLWGAGCRAFSPQRVVDEIEHMANNYGTQGLYFLGDNFTINKKRTIKLCEQIKKSKKEIEWICDTRADMISRDLLRIMKEAGCKTIWFGVESGSPKILEKINKGITIEQNIQAFKLCKEQRIQTACSFMIGIPGETLNDIDMSYKFARKLNPDWTQFNIYIAYPGSSLYDEVMEKGLFDRQQGFLKFVKTNEFDFDLMKKIQLHYQSKLNLSFRNILKKIRREGILTVLKKTPRYFHHSI